MMRKCLPLLLILLLLAGCGVPIPETPADGALTVRFLDVGQADSILLECGGEFLLIDGGNVADSDLVVAALERYGVETLAAVVCTHPHEDHVGGLPGVLAVYPTETVYAPTTTYSSRCFDDFLYYVDQQRLTVTIPAPGDRFSLGDALVTVLGPVKAYPDPNDTSIVLRVDYGDTRFLFTGDMEQTAEADLLDSGADLRADVLKAGHHGSSTSTGYRFLYAVEPEYAVISVGEGNPYGHPHWETISRLHDAEIPIYRTDHLGTITAVSDGYDITFTWEKPSGLPDRGDAEETVYIGNTSSHKFHLPTCSGLPSEKNQIFFDTYQDAVNAGYTPCSRCLG